METQLNPKHEAWTIFLVEWVCEHEWHLITLMVYQYSHPPFRRGSTQSRMCEISTNLTTQLEESNTVHNKSTLNELYPAPKKKTSLNLWALSHWSFCDVGMQTETSHTKNVSFPANHHASIFILRALLFLYCIKIQALANITVMRHSDWTFKHCLSLGLCH